MPRYGTRPARFRRLPLVVSAAVAALALMLTGCAPTGADSETVTSSSVPYPVLPRYAGVSVIQNQTYGLAGRTALRLDVCMPDVSGTDPAALKTRAAVLSIHGGSWAHGDKDNPNWRSVCEWLASEGFVAVSVNYRLAPTNEYPDQLDDIKKAVRWLREPAQLERFTVDPARIGVFGGSAGGNLAAMLGTSGTGPLDSGARVAAVAELSGPADLTEAGRKLGGLTKAFEQVQLNYLGCSSLRSCPQAKKASPLYHVNASDPPFFVGHSTDELIPLEQSEAFVSKLRANGISVEFITVKGRLHSIAMLDKSMRDRIATFFTKELASAVPGIVPGVVPTETPAATPSVSPTSSPNSSPTP